MVGIKSGSSPASHEKRLSTAGSAVQQASAETEHLNNSQTKSPSPRLVFRFSFVILAQKPSILLCITCEENWLLFLAHVSLRDKGSGKRSFIKSLVSSVFSTIFFSANNSIIQSSSVV